LAKQECLHHGLIQQRKRAAMRGVVVQGQCSGCRRSVGPRAVVDRNSQLAIQARPWLPKTSRPKTKLQRERGRVFKTKELQELRLRVLARDSYICRCCGAFGDTVHHLPGSYGNETEDNLITACRTCQLEEKSLRITSGVLGEVRH